jgi:hypothetical protein
VSEAGQAAGGDDLVALLWRVFLISRPGDGPRVPRRDAARRSGQGGPLLLDEVPREVRDYAVREGAAAETVVLAQGLREKADEFTKGGGEIDRKA